MFIVLLILIAALIVWSNVSGTAAAIVAGVLVFIWIIYAVTKAKSNSHKARETSAPASGLDMDSDDSCGSDGGCGGDGGGD